MYKIVIDANVWIKYARAKNISPLIDRLLLYNFIPVVNNYLMAEIFDAIVENKWMTEIQATKLIQFISGISIIKAGKAVFALSPDPKDNYLFDLAIQNNCVFIITDDLALLHISIKPIHIHTSNWFLKHFPV